MYDQNYLVHYGIIGMKWGQRRLQRGINRAKARGDRKKVTQLKQRLSEEKSIEKMKTSDKFLLSRQGVLANQRLISKGQSQVHRLLKLHGLAVATDFTADYLAKRIKPNKILDIDVNSGQVFVKKEALAMTVGTKIIKNLLTKSAKDYMYSKIGQN